MVMKVVIPATTSVFTLVLFSDSLKSFSNMISPFLSFFLRSSALYYYTILSAESNSQT